MSPNPIEVIQDLLERFRYTNSDQRGIKSGQEATFRTCPDCGKTYFGADLSVCPECDVILQSDRLDDNHSN